MTSKPLQCSASPELYASVEAAAERDGLSVSAWVRRAVESVLRPVVTPLTLREVQLAALREDYDDEPAGDVQEPPGRSAGKVCRGCGEEFSPYHPAVQYCPVCKAGQGPRECQICGGKCQHDLCQSCYARHRNADWLVRQFIRRKMRNTEDRHELWPADRAFRRWAHVDLNVATVLDKADGSPAYHLLRELKEAGYSASGIGGLSAGNPGFVFGTVTGVSATA